MINNNHESSRSRLNAAGNNLAYLLIGGTIGATIALLFAPKPGSELRQDISDGARQGLDVANEKFAQAKEAASGTVSQIRETADNYYHQAQDKVSSIYQVAVKAVNDGTKEAKDLASSAAGEAQNMLKDAASEAKEAPHFESGVASSDPRTSRTGTV